MRSSQIVGISCHREAKTSGFGDELETHLETLVRVDTHRLDELGRVSLERVGAIAVPTRAKRWRVMPAIRDSVLFRNGPPIWRPPRA